jgi:hypothetical protein
MNKAIIAVTSMLFSSGFALAADTAAPATKPGDAPTKAMDSATPDMKSPADPNAQHPPAAAMDKAVPTMKPGDKATESKDTTTTVPSTKAMDATTTVPSTKPGADGPTKAVDSAVPEMKSPGDPNAEHPPAAAMDKAVPPMKAGDKATDSKDSTNAPAKQ